MERGRVFPVTRRRHGVVPPTSSNSPASARISGTIRARQRGSAEGLDTTYSSSRGDSNTGTCLSSTSPPAWSAWIWEVTAPCNGARLTQLLAAHAADLDWVGLSVDSADKAVQARSLDHAREIRARGLRLKLNTVVTALNWREDMSEFVRQVEPERWKVFQVLPVGGQNDGAVDDLLIDAAQFRAFVDRHASLSKNLAPIAEDNDAMTASYADRPARPPLRRTIYERFVPARRIHTKRGEQMLAP